MFKRIAAFGVLALGLSWVAPVAPALADHANASGHMKAPPTVCYDSDRATLAPLMAETKTAWTNAGYPIGFGADACGTATTATPVMHVGSDYSRPACTGYSSASWDAELHVTRSDTTVNVNGCSSADVRQGLFSHEIGHALGLGHTATANCVMDVVVAVRSPCQHDADAMAATYAHTATAPTTTTTTSPPAPAQGNYILNIGNAQVATVYGYGSSVRTLGAAIVQYQPTGGANQQWVLSRLSDGSYLIRSVASGQYLSARDDHLVNQYTDDGGTRRHWIITDHYDGSVEIRNSYLGLCLDVPGATTGGGVQLWVYACNATTAQRWAFRAP